tara:strand:- start:48 stop:182 length:135 start_codon:yes stop_codon:yes gene_type:complete
MIFNTVSVPNKYEPLSPRNIFAFGKLNNKKHSNITVCAAIIEVT